MQNTVHGLKVLLVALVAKEGFCFVFELPLSNQAFAAGGAPTYFAPVLVRADGLEAARTQAGLLFLPLLALARQHSQQLLWMECPFLD